MYQHPEHVLSPLSRLAIYTDIGWPMRPDTWRIHGWLAVLTAQRVLPIWEEAIRELIKQRQARYGKLDLDYHLPTKILQILADTLCRAESRPGFLASYIVSELYDDFGSIFSEGSYRTFFAGTASFRAMETVALPEDFEESIRWGLEWAANHSDKEWGPNADAADAALKASACVTTNVSILDFGMARSHNEVVFDPQRRLKFWEWWLKEAIPEAWRLAYGVAD